MKDDTAQIARSNSGLLGWIPAFLEYGRRSRREEEEKAKTNVHLQQALTEEKLTGQRIAVWARSIAIIISGIVLVYVNPRLEVLYYEAFMLAFLALGWLQLRYARVGQSRMELFLIQADLLLLAFVLLVPNPFMGEGWPTAAQFRFEGFIYFFLFLAVATLAYSWRTVIAMGTWTAAIWAVGAVLVAFFGTTIPELSDGIRSALTGREHLFGFLDPNSVMPNARVQEVVVFLLVAAILALKSWRSNQLLMRQAELASERANLSRYFPPTLVEDLAHRDQPLSQVRSQEVAVLFADLVGFTRFAESRPPQEVVDTLRRYHALLEQAVFDHHGTLDKYLGDGIMATFGTPQTSPDDAANALAATLAILKAMDEWNRERKAGGLQELPVSVGVHFGPVILGDIGSERRLEFATLGDTVNVASRLESATRELGIRMVASDTLVSAIASEERRMALCNDLAQRPGLVIRGRNEAVDVWLC